MKIYYNEEGKLVIDGENQVLNGTLTIQTTNTIIKNVVTNNTK